MPHLYQISLVLLLACIVFDLVLYTIYSALNTNLFLFTEFKNYVQECILLNMVKSVLPALLLTLLCVIISFNFDVVINANVYVPMYIGVLCLE